MDTDDTPSVSFQVGPQYLSMDPRTGEYRNYAKPFPKSAWNEVAKPHTVTVRHADGSETEVTIVGATHTELRDQEFVLAVVTGDWDRWLTKQRVTNEQWHEYLITLADKHTDKVKVADCIKPMRPDDPEMVT